MASSSPSSISQQHFPPKRNRTNSSDDNNTDVPEDVKLRRRGSLRRDSPSEPILPPATVDTLTTDFTQLVSPRNAIDDDGKAEQQQQHSDDNIKTTFKLKSCRKSWRSDKLELNLSGLDEYSTAPYDTSNAPTRNSAMVVPPPATTCRQTNLTFCGDTVKRNIQEAYKEIMSEIVPGVLYLGGAPAGLKRQELLNANVAHVVNCVGQAQVPNAFPSDFTYLTLDIHDHASQDVISHIYNVLDFIEKARESGNATFLHCVKGISRSPTFAMAYLIWKDNLTFDEAFKKVKTLRPVTNPNPGFVFQISEWALTRPGRRRPRHDETDVRYYVYYLTRRISSSSAATEGNDDVTITGPLGKSELSIDRLKDPSDVEVNERAYVLFDMQNERVSCWLGNCFFDNNDVIAKEKVVLALKQLCTFEGLLYYSDSRNSWISSGSEPQEFWKDLSSVFKTKSDITKA